MRMSRLYSRCDIRASGCELFRLATEAGITLAWLDKVLAQTVAEKPKSLAALTVVQNSAIFALAQQGRIIAYDQISTVATMSMPLMRRMKDWFDKARDRAADDMENPSYISLLESGRCHHPLSDRYRPAVAAHAAL